MKGGKQEVHIAMQEAQGYNIVSSKSTKALPIAKPSALPSKFIFEQDSNLNTQEETI